MIKNNVFVTGNFKILFKISLYNKHVTLTEYVNVSAMPENANATGRRVSFSGTGRKSSWSDRDINIS